MAHRIPSLDKVARGPSFFRRHLETVRVIRRSPRIAIGLSMVLVFVLIALLAPWISPYDPIKINLRAKYASPSAKYWLGTDNVGRDVLSRLIWGTRVSLATAILSIVFAVIMGGLIGVAAGFFGGKLDTLLCGFVDILLGPSCIHPGYHPDGGFGQRFHEYDIFYRYRHGASNRPVGQGVDPCC